MIREFFERMYANEESEFEQRCVLSDIKRLEETLPERDRRDRLVSDILLMLNDDTNGNDKVHAIIDRIREFSGIEAIAVRLRQERDAPYFMHQGFSEEFVLAENYLCSPDDGMECMCGAVLEARTDPRQPFFTLGGSFWTNSSSEFLEELGEDPQYKVRNRCAKEGYESVALVPLRSGNDIVGLLQLNDSRAGRFDEEGIVFYETLGSMIGVALRRVVTEMRLRESEAHYKAMLEAVPSMIFRAEADGTVLEAGGRRDFFYVPPEEHIGRRIRDYLPKRPAQALMAAIRRCIEGADGDAPAVCHYELPVRGRQRKFEARIVRYAAAPGQVIAVVTDITGSPRRKKKGR